MLKVLKKDGFASLVEVLVTAVIFSLAAVGIYATIIMVTPDYEESHDRLTAIYHAKQIIEELRDEVDATTWNSVTSNLAVGTYSKTFANYTIDWEIEDIPGMGLRRLNMEIQFL